MLNVKRYILWAVVAVVAALAAGKVYVSRKAVVYQASDPTLLTTTGRPQLVEFYHRA